MAQAWKSKWRLIAVAFATALTAAATAAAYVGHSALVDQRDDGSFLLWDHPEVVAHGRLLYAGHCAACHGANGEGQRQLPEGATASTPLPPPHDASGHTWRHPDYALLQLTKAGVATAFCRSLEEGAMPKFERTLTFGGCMISAILRHSSSLPSFPRPKNGGRPLQISRSRRKASSALPLRSPRVS
jgi:hypothetical protein